MTPPLDAATVTARADLIAALQRLPFLTPTEASVIAGCSASHIRRACLAGTLAATRIASRQWRIRPAALTDWVAGATPARRPLGRAS